MVRRRRWAVASTMGILVLFGTGAVHAAASTPGKSVTKSAPKLYQQGHVTFWECPAKTTQVLIGVNKLTLHPGDTLSINFVVRNQGTSACNFVAPYAGEAPGPTASTLQVGPCGSMGFVINAAHRRDVWPGPQPFNCPALGFAQLQPNASTVGSGTWNQTVPSGSKRVRPGDYTLVVAGRYTFPLHIEKH
jgi:hypothetical protein